MPGVPQAGEEPPSNSETQPVYQGRQDHRSLALVLVGDPDRVMPEGPFAREPFVAMNDHFLELAIANGLGKGAMVVQV